MSDGWRTLVAELADQVAAVGASADAAWDRALRDTPRHLFVPAYSEQRSDGTWRRIAVDPDDPVAVYRNEPLITAVRTDKTGYGTVLSSSSKPGLMVRMLDALDLADGHRVLEIGLGTGYNAALLCHRLGDQHVASVDVEPDLVDAAADRLARLGYHPTVTVGDGAAGMPDTAPYDRIIATCSVSTIPPAWAAQLTPGGRILADIKITGNAGNLVLLHQLGNRLEGRFLPRWAGFMPLRGAAQPPRAEAAPQARVRTTTMPTATPWWDLSLVWFLAALRLPAGMVTGMRLDPNTRQPVAATCRAANGSWADVALRDTDGHREVRTSETDLWGIVEDTYQWWHDVGEPGWHHFGLTVTDHEQTVWFKDPTGTRWSLPTT